ncbi:hypothetical protein [Cellulosimicrobium sp. 22601]|uniref:hypothetical protein n=1 Tax=unclassified Cellulosimicrobium TaxID=2624466 RepID=UPI003F8297D4
MDKAISLLTELRHWRAAVPTGIFAAAFVILEWLRKAPSASEDSLQASTLGQSVTLFPAATIAVVGVVLILLVGSWWCAFAVWCFGWTQIAALHALPIDRPVNEWNRWQRLFSPIPFGDLSQLQRTISASPDYVDLLKADQKGAHVKFLSEVIHTSDTSMSELPGSSDTVRTLTDIRVLAGLLLWGPLCVWSIGQGLDSALTSASGTITFCAIGLLVVLLLSLWHQGRLAVGSASRLMASNERVSASARSAQGWGLKPIDRQNLEDELT